MDITAKIVGVLRNAEWIKEGDPRSPCLCGEVYGDTKGRFRDGTSIVTSTVMSEDDGTGVFQTRYSAYKVESWKGEKD